MKSEKDEEALVLCCEHCGFNYTHLFKTEIFSRSEDAEMGDHMIFKGFAEIESELHFDHSLSGNPSSRRSGVSLFFNCENCDYITRLNISQHKGVTIIDTKEFLERKKS
jgi:RNase P subunit RPR2